MNLKTFLFLTILSLNSFATTDFQCAPIGGVQTDIVAVSTETLKDGNTTLHLYKKNSAGSKIQKDLDADRSVDQGTIFFTTDESVLIVDPQDHDPVSGGARSMYMLPPTQEQIPMICQNLI